MYTSNNMTSLYLLALNGGIRFLYTVKQKSPPVEQSLGGNGAPGSNYKNLYFKRI